MRRLRRWLVLVALAPGLAWAQLIASGDITDKGAVLWMHAEAPGRYTIEVAEDAAFGRVIARAPVLASDKNGFMGQAALDALKPSTRYHYRVVGAHGPLPRTGSFATAPAPADRAALKLLFGADLGGQGYGRLRSDVGLPIDGWPIFRAMSAEQADLFIALGDMLYADRRITAEAPDYPKGNDFQIPKPGPGYVTSVEDFRRDWFYHRSDHQFAQFLALTPLIATWDDHEIVNDSGGPELLLGPSAEELARDPRLKQGDPSRPRGEFMPWSSTKDPQGRRRSVFYNPALFRAARQVMFEFNPIQVLPDRAGTFERRLYRNLRWGAHAEIIMLDTRSYRDPRYRVDSDAAPKTMLGAAQKRWLLDLLETSSATWKIVVSSVPLSIEGGSERDPQGRTYGDTWASADRSNPYAYARELGEIVAHVKRKGVRNVLFLTGDKHFSNIFSYDPDGDGIPDFHEANIGPLRAGRASGRSRIDPTFRPTRIFTDAGMVDFAYGWVSIDAATGRLTMEVRRVDGTTAQGSRLQVDPR